MRFRPIVSLLFFLLVVVATKAAPALPDSTLARRQKVTVHFMVDFRPAMARVKIPESIGVRGNLAPLSWERTFLLTDADQNGVYEASITFEYPGQEYVLEYKYVHDQSHYESIGNRSVWLKNKPINLPLDKWNIPARISGKAQFMDKANKNLFNTIAALDSSLFSTIYTCNPQVNRRFFTEDLEFYHDKNGVTKGRTAFMDALEKSFCLEKKPYRLVRKLIKNTLKVYPLDGFGAVQSGEHRFYEVAPGEKGKLTGTARFTHIWHFANGEWKLSRIISYDHQSVSGK